MKKKNDPKINAVETLHERYIGSDAERKASVEEERVNAKVARMIYEARKEAGLTQQELAERINTTQSVIRRLEVAHYAGHSLTMLYRIAEALGKEPRVWIAEKDEERLIARESGKRLAKLGGTEKELEMPSRRRPGNT